MNLSNNSVTELLKIAKKNGGKVSAEEYRRVLLSSEPNVSKKKIAKEVDRFISENVVDEGKKSSVATLDKSYQASAEYDSKHDRYCLTIKFRHLGKNSINGTSMQTRIAYKTLCKNVIGSCAKILNHRGVRFNPLEKASLRFIFTVPQASRDRDANYTTINFLIDGLVKHGFLIDDNRNVVKSITESEELDSDAGYCVTIFVKKSF